jgi:hypothetical protein
MTISQHAESFYNQKVKPFDDAGDWEGPDTAYRVAITWDDKGKALAEKLGRLLACDGADRLQALVIGAWNGDDSGVSSQSIVDELVKQRTRLAGLKALFLGDITFEENEISWIEQSNVSPLLDAFPGLEVFRVRGGNSLQFAPVRHESLTQLIVETGGLPRSVISEICGCDFPRLEHLELWLGEENYGFDGGVEDVRPLLAGRYFPKLTYLGLRNSAIADDIASVVPTAPILQRLRSLDLSNGTLSDVGARALLTLPAGIPLRELNLSHHYMTEDMVDRLRDTLNCLVIADDGQDPDEEWRGVVVSE